MYINNILAHLNRFVFDAFVYFNITNQKIKIIKSMKHRIVLSTTRIYTCFCRNIRTIDVAKFNDSYHVTMVAELKKKFRVRGLVRVRTKHI